MTDLVRWARRECLREVRCQLRARLAETERDLVILERQMPAAQREREALVALARTGDPTFTARDDESADTLRMRVASVCTGEVDPDDEYSRGVVHALTAA